MGEPRPGDHGPKNGRRLAQRVGLEEHPGHRAQEKGKKHLNPHGDGVVIGQAHTFPQGGAWPYGDPADHLIEAVEQSPDEEGQPRAVPQSADGEDDEHIQIFPYRSLSAAPQGDVEVIAEPGGQGDMPPPPELRDGAGEIGRLEVLHQLHPQHLGAAQGHVGIGGEIAIDLDGEGAGGGDDLEPSKRTGICVDGGDQHTQPVGDDQLFEGPPQKPEGPQPQAIPGGTAAGAELGHHLFRPSDGSREELGKEGQKEGYVENIPPGFGFFPIRVHQIARRHKEIEGDAGGKQQSGGLDGPAQTGQQLAGEVQVFEEEEGAEEHDQQKGQNTPPFPPGTAAQYPSAHIGDESGAQEGEQPFRSGPQGEQPACRQQPEPGGFGGKEQISGHDQGKEEKKGQREHIQGKTHLQSPI